MSRVKAPHHRDSHQRRAQAVVAAANANPHTVCWRDGLTLAEHPPTKTGRPPRWTAGHVEDEHGNLVVINGRYLLLPEADVCNYREGAAKGNRRRANPQSRQW